MLYPVLTLTAKSASRTMNIHLAYPLSELEDLASLLLTRGETLGTAESCTGGLIAALITSLPGSSAWFKGGITAYANELKTALLGVPEDMLATHGAVSEATALAMARGTVKALHVSHSLAVTGIAGPDGGTKDKPVGTVWLAWCVAGQATARRCLFEGDRAGVRTQAAETALRELARLLRARV